MLSGILLATSLLGLLALAWLVNEVDPRAPDPLGHLE